MLCDFASHTTDGGITLRVHTPLVRTTRKDKSCFQVGLGWRYDGTRKHGATDGTPRQRARTVERVPSAAKDFAVFAFASLYLAYGVDHGQTPKARRVSWVNGSVFDRTL